MIKLECIDNVSDVIRARDIAEVCSLLERGKARPVLLCVWAIEERTGRPVCRWTAHTRNAIPGRRGARLPSRLPGCCGSPA